MSERVEELLRHARIAVTPDGEVSSGYDGLEAEASMDAVERYGCNPADVWTAAERIELADAMIARWTAFRDLQQEQS
jgi:hypothetical protein